MQKLLHFYSLGHLRKSQAKPYMMNGRDKTRSSGKKLMLYKVIFPSFMTQRIGFNYYMYFMHMN